MIRKYQRLISISSQRVKIVDFIKQQSDGESFFGVKMILSSGFILKYLMKIIEFKWRSN